MILRRHQWLDGGARVSLVSAIETTNPYRPAIYCMQTLTRTELDRARLGGWPLFRHIYKEQRNRVLALAAAPKEQMA